MAISSTIPAGTMSAAKATENTVFPVFASGGASSLSLTERAVSALPAVPDTTPDAGTTLG